jgi:hypothetical protein
VIFIEPSSSILDNEVELRSVAEAFVMLRAGLEFALASIAASSGGRFDCGFRLMTAGAYWIKPARG